MFGSFVRRMRRVSELMRHHGVSRTASMVLQRLRFGPGGILKSRNVFAQFDFVRVEKVQLASQPARPNTLLWFIPDFNIGSGGH